MNSQCVEYNQYTAVSLFCIFAKTPEPVQDIVARSLPNKNA